MTRGRVSPVGTPGALDARSRKKAEALSPLVVVRKRARDAATWKVWTVPAGTTTLGAGLGQGLLVAHRDHQAALKYVEGLGPRVGVRGRPGALVSLDVEDLEGPAGCGSLGDDPESVADHVQDVGVIGSDDAHGVPLPVGLLLVAYSLPGRSAVHHQIRTIAVIGDACPASNVLRGNRAAPWLPFSSVDDRILGARLRAGDDSALAEIFDQLGPLVLGLARRLTGSSAMAEDVMQEVFTSLWTQPDRFDPERGSLRAYLGVMSHRRSVDAVRRSSSRQRREEKVGGLDLTTGQQEDVADATAISQSVQAALVQLPDDQRRTVELAFWQGMTHQEIARALGIPEGTVKSRLRLAQAKLRDRLGGLAMALA